jgi:hypothetical protein
MQAIPFDASPGKAIRFVWAKNHCGEVAWNVDKHMDVWMDRNIPVYGARTGKILDMILDTVEFLRNLKDCYDVNERNQKYSKTRVHAVKYLRFKS